MSELFRLKGQIKQYEWGGKEFLPRLLGLPNPEQRPFAEYWMGIHPQGPAVLSAADQTCSLADKEPHLSFLLKLLDVHDMLSIQVHPTREMAAADFERENEQGIPLDSPQRNYKDPNHKPELMVALSSFWLLHGFRKEASLVAVFDRYPFLEPLREEWLTYGYERLYRWVMEMPSATVNDLLHDGMNGLTQQYDAGSLSRSDPGFWAARAHRRFSVPGQIDRGIFSIFLLNLVRLEKGQGIFQGAGVPHAYLEGQNVEIMANSDNVLRGGLTPKHIDVPELLRHIRTEPIDPIVLAPSPDHDGFQSYPAPVRDFKICSIELSAGEQRTLQTDSGSILLVPEGRLILTTGGETIELGKPDLCAYLTPGVSVGIRSQEPSWLFIASGASASIG